MKLKELKKYKTVYIKRGRNVDITIPYRIKKLYRKRRRQTIWVELEDLDKIFKLSDLVSESCENKSCKLCKEGYYENH